MATPQNQFGPEALPSRVGHAFTALSPRAIAAVPTVDTTSVRAAVRVTRLECSAVGPSDAYADVTAAPTPRLFSGIRLINVRMSAKLSNESIPYFWMTRRLVISVAIAVGMNDSVRAIALRATAFIDRAVTRRTSRR